MIRKAAWYSNYLSHPSGGLAAGNPSHIRMLRWLAGEASRREALLEKPKSDSSKSSDRRSNKKNLNNYEFTDSKLRDLSWIGSQQPGVAGRLRARTALGELRESYQPGFGRRAEDQIRVAEVGAVSKLCEEGQLGEAVGALDLLVHRGYYVPNYVFYGVLKTCISQKDLVLGCRLHTLAIKSGYESNAFLANHIICMYASHGRLEEAMQVFSRVATPNRYMWASIILAHARHGQPTVALYLYRQMRETGVKPNNRIFVGALKACAAAKDLCSGREVHADMLGTTHAADAFVNNSLVDMYAKCGSLEDARRVFDNVPTRDVVTWNAMITGYTQHGLGQDALTLYASMQQERITAADRVTFLSLLQACSSAGSLHQGKQLHAQVQERGLDADVVVGNCLVDMYSKCGSIEDARCVFDNLPTRDVVTWTAMIAGYAQLGLGREALTLYARMQHDCVNPANHMTFACLLQACASIKDLHQGKILHAQIQERGLETDVVVSNCLVDMYSKCGSLEDARRVFDALPIKDVVTWTAMIAGYAHHGLGQKALTLYASMRQMCLNTADVVTFVCLLQACGSVAGLEKGKEIYSEISEAGLCTTDLFVANAVIDMYGKCGSMFDAQQVFDALPARDIVTWNALIAGYARQGDSERVLDLFNRTTGEVVEPDGVTLLSVLTVCSHVGLVDKGQEYFEAMSRDYGITPSLEHFTCMVDLLGRAGQVDKAMQMVRTMPFEPDIVVWTSMLGACRKWLSVEFARHAFECAIALDKNDAAAYVLMANIYAAAQMREQAKEIQAMRVKTGAWKKPGQSWWTDLRGIVHTFVVGDREHPERQNIDARMQNLFVKMKKEGYVAALDCVLLDIPEDEKEAALCGHSERLAIAYALNKTPEGTTIRVVKNLRVCEDCHNVTALISKVERRIIVCRDASRFHVFKDGECSCGDYW